MRKVARLLRLKRHKGQLPCCTKRGESVPEAPRRVWAKGFWNRLCRDGLPFGERSSGGTSLLRLLDRPAARLDHVAGQADQLERADGQVGHVELPPAAAVRGTPGVGVVIVVP